MIPLLFLLLQTVYVSNEETNVVHIVDGTTLAERGRIDIGQRLRGMALSPDGRRLYIADEDDNLLSFVDVGERRITSEVLVGGSRRGRR